MLRSHEVQTLRDCFWQNLQETFGKGIALNGHPTERLPNTLNVTFVGRSGAEMLRHIPSVAASTGSVCHSGSAVLSPVLAAMGSAPEIGMGAVRFSLGRYTTEEEIEEVLALL
jgi:cysteine desulfurase